jgi:Asp/Glu/hydantoin racemase
MAEAARLAASPGTEVIEVTAPRGVSYISTRAEAQIGGAVALDVLASAPNNIDAAIIAAFGDPGVQACRELFDFPVIGVSEAAMLTACMLGKRFVIATFSTDLIGWYQDCVELNGMTLRCAGIHALDLSFADVSNDQQNNGNLVIKMAEQVVRDSSADCLIFGGAPLAGIARRAREIIPVPIVDPVSAAVKQAEALVALNPRKATFGNFRRPIAKLTSGLSETLAARLEHRDGASK